MQPKEPPSYFPELKGDEQRQADEWLRGYLRLVMRIYREHLDEIDGIERVPKRPLGAVHSPSVDSVQSTGNVGTCENPSGPFPIT